MIPLLGIARRNPAFSESTVDFGPYTCPVCRAVSFNPNDTRHGYCGRCKAVTGIPFDGPGTKVLVVGDTHGMPLWMEKTVVPYAKAAGCVTIMQCGDFGFVWDNNIDVVNRELDWLHGILDDAGLRLVFLPGNYENHPMLAQLAEAADRNEDGHYLLRPTVLYAGRVAAWTWDGLRLAAVGGAVSVDADDRRAGTSWWPEEMLQPDEVEAAAALGPVDILFTHDAPTGVPARLIPDVASMAHRAYMAHIGAALVPAYWFHGHYHDSLHYRFHHTAGTTTVRGLHCNHTPSPSEAMVPINLRSIREGLGVPHDRPEV